MNIIPSTFNEHQINCIILGGKYNDSPDALNISVVLLSDEGKTYKGKMLSKILQAGYSYDFPVVLEESIEDNLSAEDIKAPGMGETDIEI